MVLTWGKTEITTLDKIGWRPHARRGFKNKKKKNQKEDRIEYKHNHQFIKKFRSPLKLYRSPRKLQNKKKSKMHSRLKI